jgi:hypothetical protein
MDFLKPAKQEQLFSEEKQRRLTHPGGLGVPPFPLSNRGQYPAHRMVLLSPAVTDGAPTPFYPACYYAIVNNNTGCNSPMNAPLFLNPVKEHPYPETINCRFWVPEIKTGSGERWPARTSSHEKRPCTELPAPASAKPAVPTVTGGDHSLAFKFYIRSNVNGNKLFNY